jgi:hypothetical protein
MISDSHLVHGNRYDCTATAADCEIHAPKAVFEDSLMQAHGYSTLLNPKTESHLVSGYQDFRFPRLQYPNEFWN